MMTSDNKSPARLHAILAREADKAVVFRRGPSSKTANLEWDLKADKFKLGQWFYGSFYPYRCDISPDGRHLVYFAAKYGRGSSIDRFKTRTPCWRQSQARLGWMCLTLDFVVVGG